MKHISERADLFHKKSETITKLVKEDKPIVMTAPYYGAPFIEFAQYNGFIMSYKVKNIFQHSLMQKYPKSFQYLGWSEQFYFWDEFVDFDYILTKTDDILYIYIGKGKGADLKVILERLYKFKPAMEIQLTTLYTDTQSDEKLIEVKFKNITKLSGSLFTDEEIQNMIESIQKDSNWTTSVQEKALKQGISFDSMLFLDAKWILENKN